jgi:hypothetical protein
MAPKRPISLNLELPQDFTVNDVKAALVTAAANDSFVKRLRNAHRNVVTVQVNSNKRFQPAVKKGPGPKKAKPSTKK